MDYGLFKIINGLAGKSFIVDKIFMFIAQYLQYFFGLVLIALWFKKDSKEQVLSNRRAGIFAMIAMGIAVGINHIIAFFYFRPRPYTEHVAKLLLHPSVDPSFPSDHATAAFAIACAVLFMNKSFGRIMIAVATILAFSRVYVGLHYPFDVIGGAIIGCITAYLIHKFSKRLNFIADFAIGVWDAIEAKILLVAKKSN